MATWAFIVDGELRTGSGMQPGLGRLARSATAGAVRLPGGGPVVVMAGPVPLIWSVLVSPGVAPERTWGLEVPRGCRLWCLAPHGCLAIAPEVDDALSALALIKGAEL